MGQKKKKKGAAYRTAVAASMAAVAMALTGCHFVEDWAAETPDPAEPGTGVPQAGGKVPVPGSALEIDVLDIATWALAALGLGPAARLVGAARPLVAPLITMLFGKPKPKAPTEQPAQ